MTNPGYRALCAELVEAYAYLIDRYMTAPSNKDALVYRARAALAQPVAEGPTDEELSRRFRAWWYDEGSGLPPLPGMDHEEHTRRISEIAWANGAYVARWGTPNNNTRGTH